MSHELVTTSHVPEEKSPEMHLESAAWLSDLPQGIREDCAKLFSELLKDVRDEIVSRMTGIDVINKEKKDPFAQFLKKLDKEDRARDGAYSRQDLEEMDEIRIEMILRSNIEILFPRYLEGEVSRIESYEEFCEVFYAFVESIWSNRGKEDFVTPEAGTLKTIETKWHLFGEEERALQERKQRLQEKIGRKRRLPDALQSELNEVGELEALMNEKKRNSTFEYSMWNGTRMQAIRYEKLFKSTVYMAEYFSAEDYAILLLETLEACINNYTRWNVGVDPELLIYTERFVNEWASEHTSQSALKFLKGERNEGRRERLVVRFVEGLKSYLRLKGHNALNEEYKTSLARELPIVLRMLKRV